MQRRPVRYGESVATVQAAWRRYLILLAGLTLTFLLSIVVIWPWPYVFAIERFMLPQYESGFGFRGGRVSADMGDAKLSIYALVEVEPGGPMASAGVRSGDIPVAQHGGLGVLYVALQNSAAGDEGRFEVLALSDWPDWSKRRRIVLPPR